MGAFYLDILKDRLYTTAADSKARRSAQTGLYHVAMILIKLMAPILSFTAEEAWSELQRTVLKNRSQEAQTKTIFTELFHELPKVDQADQLLTKWERILEIRTL